MNDKTGIYINIDQLHRYSMSKTDQCHIKQNQAQRMQYLLLFHGLSHGTYFIYAGKYV